MFLKNNLNFLIIAFLIIFVSMTIYGQSNTNQIILTGLDDFNGTGPALMVRTSMINIYRGNADAGKPYSADIVAVSGGTATFNC